MNKRFFLLFLSVLCFALIGNAQQSVSVRGILNASELPDYAKVELTGHTTLNMNVDKKLFFISDHTTDFNKVDCDLTITGSGKLSFCDYPDGFSAIESCIRARNVVISENSVVEAASKYKTHPTLEVHSLIVRGYLTATNNAEAITAKNNIELSGGTLNVVSSVNAIYSREGAIILNGTVLAVAGEMAIYSKTGNVEILGGTVEAEAVNRGISAGGNVVISGGKISAKVAQGSNPIAIRAEGNIEVSGNAEVAALGSNVGMSAKVISILGGSLNVSAKNAIVASNKIHFVQGEVTALSMGGDAIRSMQNIIVDGGSITSSSILNNYGMWAQGTIAFNRGEIDVRGKTSAVYAGGGITLDRCGIQLPANGIVSGSEIVSSNNTTAKHVRLGLPEISGSVNTSLVVCMQPVYYTLEGKVATLDKSAITAQWQYSDDENIWYGMTWKDIPGATGNSYTPTTEYLGKIIRVRITADGYARFLCKNAGWVTKVPQNNTPDEPILQIADNKVRVTNARTRQEYIMLSSPKLIADLTENDWNSSKSPSVELSNLDLGGTPGYTYFVYTRFKETDSYNAGWNVQRSSIYLRSTATAVQSISFKVEKNIGGTSIKPEYTTEIEHEGDVYYAKKGDLFKITVVPQPENATFNGISGSRFFSNAQGGTFHSDFRANMPVNSTENYKVVYFLAGDQKNYADVQAEYTKGYNDVIRAVTYFHIADKDGNYAMNRFESVTADVKAGEKLEGISVVTRPGKAALDGLTTSLRSYTGTVAPVITFNTTDRTMSVDATSATEGTYYFDVYQNGVIKTSSTSIMVRVTGTLCEGITINPSSTQAEPGDELELEAQLLPTNVQLPISWSCTQYAQVSSSGKLKILPTVPRGTVITVTASAGGHNAQSEITIPKLPSELAFSEIFKVAYLGEEFTPPTLNNPHALSISYVSGNPAVASVDNSTGAVTIYSEGLTIIKAETPGNADYSSDSVVYMLYVTENPTSGISVLSSDSKSSTDHYYTLDGRQLHGKPTTKGVYIHKNCKVVIR